MSKLPRSAILEMKIPCYCSRIPLFRQIKQVKHFQEIHLFLIIVKFV